MAKYLVEYHDEIEVDADSEDEALSIAWDDLFADGEKYECMSATKIKD